MLDAQEGEQPAALQLAQGTPLQNAQQSKDRPSNNTAGIAETNHEAGMSSVHALQPPHDTSSSKRSVSATPFSISWHQA